MDMNGEENFTSDNIISHLKEKSEQKVGFICLNYLLINCKVDDLYDFSRRYGIEIPEKDFITRLEFIKIIILHLTNMYYGSELQTKFDNALEYIGNTLINDSNIGKCLHDLDFIVKQDLIDVFADYCADSGITVYNTNSSSIGPKMDMYLAKKKTEAAFVMTGLEINGNSYSEIKSLTEKAKRVANWITFVTTPIGALKIGLRKLIFEMSQLSYWLYIVDPSRKLIFRILKGKRNNEYDIAERDKYIKNLPREPLRAPSQLITLSDYTFSETKSFNTNDFGLFDIYDEIEHNMLILKEQENPKYTNIFRDLIIIEIISGTPIVSYTSENFKEQTLASGFLTAMDSYISQIGGTRLEEINYMGFYVQAAYGEFTKLACFLSEPADKSLKDRLSYLIETFEKKYADLIEKFRKSGNTDLFNQDEIISLIKEILNI
jgi:hypothetical protein